MPSDEKIQLVLEMLGYKGTTGYLVPSGLSTLKRHRHAFGEAFEHFSVIGIFSLTAKPNRTTKSSEEIPLVYVAVARTADDAREIHRATWSQGIVPFLVVITDDALISCNALSYSSQAWHQNIALLSMSAIAPGTETPAELKHLTARALRTSVVWADREMGFESRIDMRLLDNLRAITSLLLAGRPDAPSLPPKTANALIGRFLYIRFLRDREILPVDWLPLLRKEDIAPRDLLPAMWTSFSRVEKVFNGSTFILTSKDHDRIKQGHASILTEVLLNNADITHGGIQTSFRDFRFSSIRTETLSAVYELFLETNSPTGGREDGAIYTPPFLVDFVLSQVESDNGNLSPSDRVLDCAAGSGVFLVGAFRRIVESTLVGRNIQTLPLYELHRLLRRCIWGIERNLDACHVAAFSLYLTMLDYLDKGELAEILKFAGRRKVFPTLVPQNILPRDFFSTKAMPRGTPKRFTAIIANPPWQRATEIGAAAVAYQDGARSASVDRGRAAPLFFWKAFDQYLSKDGRFGFVMSGRALISSGASRFPTALIAEAGVSRLINLSHLRRKLFPRAEHPAVVVVGRKSQASDTNEVRIFSPLLSSQPVAKDGTPWAIIEDRRDVEIFRRARIQTATELIRALTLRPIDRQIARWLSDRAASKAIPTLGQVMDSNGLAIKRGGYLPETNVASSYTLGSDANKSNYYRRALGLDSPQLFPGTSQLLPADVQRRIAETYLRPFGGGVIIIPRSMTHIDYVEQPFAFNSSINAIYSMASSKEAAHLLKAMTHYLNTDFAEYCFTLFGRDWSLDERRLEKKELRQLPAPPSLLDPAGALDFSERLSAEGESAIYTALGLPETFQSAAREFASFRSDFLNGQIPEGVHNAPEEEQIAQYSAALSRELSAYVGKRRRFSTAINRIKDRKIAIVVIDYLRDDEQVSAKSTLDETLRVFDRDGINVFQDSAWIIRSTSSSRLSVIKPLSRVHWTVERAFADAERIVTEAVTTPG